MAYGPDTDLLLEILKKETTEVHLANMQLHSLPDLRPYKQMQKLFINRTPIGSLPTLPEGLRALWCNRNNIGSLPDLPNNLKILNVEDTHITTLPELPFTLGILECTNCPLLFHQKEGRCLREYNLEWRIWREKKESRERSFDCTKIII